MMAIALTTFGLGAIAAIASILILIPLKPEAVRPGGWSKVLAAAAFCVPLVAVLMVVGRGGAEPTTVAASLPGLPEGHPPTGKSGEPDWSLMTHMYLGGPPPGAAPGDAGPGDAGSAVATQRADRSADELAMVTQREPGNAEAWLALANARRQARDFAQAVTAFEKALQLQPKNADAWADYADALASSRDRKLAGAPAKAIATTLRLDPKHLKGLWLQASLDLEQQRYDAALTHWQQLRAALPAGSPDTAIIDANITEARQLAARPVGGG
jgi:hypothetical protein